ncbi:MAG: hypothetical protein K6F07_03480 [Bacilli bacterium]|nr:hypothetical protein [Bacilli bacterium]
MKNNKMLRRFLYALPVVLFGAASIASFSIAANVKKEYEGNKEVQTLNALVTKIQKEYVDNPSAYLDPKGEVYEEYTLATNRLNAIAKKSNASYRTTSILAYTCSILTLVSFGVVLYVSDKVKEKEETYVEPIVPVSKEEQEQEDEEELEQLEKDTINE